MYGRFIYFAAAALLGVMCSLSFFLLYFFLAFLYLLLLFLFKRFSIPQISVLLLIILIFYFSSHLALQANHTKIPLETTRFLLEYTDAPKIDGNMLQILAKDSITGEKILVRYRISKEEEKRMLETKSFFGCLCLVKGTLLKPPSATNENAFDYRSYLNNRHIFWILDSDSGPLENCQKQKLTPLTALKKWRSIGINDLRSHFPPQTAALSAALIYGDKELMSPDLLNNYQETGISHLLAISGLHVTLLVMMIFYLGIRVGLTREFMTNLLLAVLPGYAVITGSSPSVVRSVLMIFLVMLTIKFRKVIKMLPIDTISLAFIVYLFFSPLIIFDAGFELSFIVSAAVIVSSRFILTRYQSGTLQMLAVSLTSQLAALPVLLYYFFEIPSISVLANLIFIPLYSYLFLPGVYLLLLIRLIFGAVPEPLIHLFTALVDLSIGFSQAFAGAALPNFSPGRPNAFLLVLYIAIVLILFILWEKAFPKEYRNYFFVSILILFQIQTGWNILNPVGEVSIIDVGQGDSIYIHLPHNQGNYLIDTGGALPFQTDEWQKRSKEFDPGRNIVVPFLKGKGVKKIDKLILTHGDLDHIGGAFAIMEEVKISQILLPSVKEPSESEIAIAEAARKKGIQIVHVSSGQQWGTKESRFFILSPNKNFAGERNQGSVTILAKIGGFNWFFGGDLNQEGEEEIVKKYPNMVIDVLKVGHHGSRTSSSPIFLSHYKPRAAIISVGEKNRFGHPHQEVINRFEKLGAKIFRTDKNGEITYRFNQGRGTFYTYLP